MQKKYPVQLIWQCSIAKGCTFQLNQGRGCLVVSLYRRTRLLLNYSEAQTSIVKLKNCMQMIFYKIQDAYTKTLKSRDKNTACLIGVWFCIISILNLCLCYLLVYSNVPAVRQIKEISCLINHRIPAGEQREPTVYTSHLSDCPWFGAEWPACGNNPGQWRAETWFIQPTGYDCHINTCLSFLKCTYWEWT